MSNLATIIKQEVTRLARRELRRETEALKTASAKYRSEIAALKRRVDDLEKQLALATRMRKIGSTNAVAGPRGSDGSGATRYSARSFAAQRKRLGLSAGDFGRLLNASTQTIYNWEANKGRPHGQQLAAFMAARNLRKRDAHAILAQA